MKQVKKLTAILLAVMVAMSMMPAMAFAEGDNAVSNTADIEAEETEAGAEEDGANAAVTVDGSAEEDPVAEGGGEAAAAEASSDEDQADDSADNGVTEESAGESAGESEENAGGEASYDEAEDGSFEVSFSEGVDPDELEGADAESLMQEFLFSDGTEKKNDSMTPERPLSVKGDRLSGSDKKYYDRFSTIIRNVSAAKRSKTYTKLSVGSFLGKRTYTASQLGLSKLAYKKNGKWYITSAAAKKIQALVEPKDWKRVYTSVLCDLSGEGYWVDWYSSQKFYRCWYRCYINGAKSITFDKSSWVRFSLPVMPEFAKDAGSGKYYVYRADLSKIRSAEASKKNAKYIVSAVDEEMNTTFAEYSPAGKDVNRLWRYCQWIAILTEYDTEAAASENVSRTSPWSLVSVLDNNENTKAVCAGYARAFKYLCDLSTFESDWIDCQLVTGYAGENHMWNVVRMNDGFNYLVDPTWMDDGDSWEDVDESWFLRGDPDGTADSFTIEYYDDANSIYRYHTRFYDEWTTSTFRPAERRLSKKTGYPWTDVDRTVSLQKPVIKKPAGGKKSVTVRWNKVTAPIGALYVDGYQIRYSTKKSMSGAKTVKVRGYNKASKVIKGLKSKKYYYVQVRTYAKMGRHTYRSEWSARKKVRTK